MTISFSKNNRGGFTLLEIMLVVGLGVIFAAIAIPTVGSWLIQNRLNAAASGLIEAVQTAKLRADDSGQAQVIVVQGAKERAPSDKSGNVSYFSADSSMQWQLSRPGPEGKPVAASEIHIDAHGLVEPITFRVSEGDKHVEYQFDFLTGHAQEQTASF